MMRTFLGLSVIVLLSGSTLGQSAPPTPTFDAADVHVRPRSTNPNPFMTGGVLRGGRYDLRNATMLDLITTAYGADPDTVLGGPSWLETDRYDLVAKAPAGTSEDTVKLMLQALLADRFKLALRSETKPQPGFALTVNGKHKLTEAVGGGPGGCQLQQQPDSAGGTVVWFVLSCHNVTMEAFAKALRPFGAGYIELPVTDQTGLKGAWDFDLKYTPRVRLVPAGSDAITLPDALERQLGLKVTQQLISTAVLTVDSVNEKPTANPSGVADNLPAPPPAEFDVADIKLSPPGTTPNGRLQPGGRLDMQGITMKMLVSLAWDINDDQLIAGAPKWFEDTRYTLLAKTSTAVGGPGNAAGPPVDIDDLRLMLRALLVERFKLATHYEDRAVNAYTLVAANPKLTKADPSNRTRFKEGPALNQKDARDANPVIGRMVTVQNMTMAQLADNLQRIAPGYIHTAVLDETGIAGAWDFSFSFSVVGLVQPPAGAAPNANQAAGGNAPTASDPNGAVSLFDALNRQLGLKLEMRKRTMPVLVIDHVEEKPAND